MPLEINDWFLPRRTSNSNSCVETKFTADAECVRDNLRPDAGTAVFTLLTCVPDTKCDW